MKLILFIILATFATRSFSQSDRSHIRKGNSKFEEGQYQEAEIEYRKALEKEPQSYQADYNLGNALYRQKQYDAAAMKYSSLAKNEKDRQNLNRYFYNLGNACYENKKYQESVEAYKNALRNNPGDMNAKHNLQLAMKMLEEKQQQQNQQQQQQEQEKNQQQQQQNQQQQEQEKDQQQQAQKPQDVKGQISPEDAERILQALENEEKDVMKKIQEQRQHRQNVPLEKNW